MVEIALNVALGLLAASLAIALFRLVRGPSLPDRVLAVDAVTLMVMGVIAIIAIKSSREYFIAVLIIAILSVISSVAVAKYLVKGRPF